MALAESTVSGNGIAASNSEGGGIFTFDGAVTLSSSTLSGNSTQGSSASGGGIFTLAGDVMLTSSTLSQNSTTRSYGGGIFTLNLNSESSLTILNSIVAGNSAAANNGTDVGFGNNPLLTVNHSLIGTGVSPTNGPTQTHAPLPGSLAIDAGDPSFAPPPDFDQRGAPFVRVFDDPVAPGTGIDIGAFEVQILTAVWDGDANTGNVGDAVNWSDTNNWQLAGVVDLAPQPGPPGDDVVFQAALTVDLESDRTVNSLAIEADYILSGHTLTMTSGIIDVPAGVAASIDSNLVSAAGITKTGDGSLHIVGAAPDVTVTAGTLVLAGTGTVENLTINNGATAILNGNVLGDLLNDGVLVVSGDLNGDGAVNAADIDLLYSQTAGRVPRADARFDLVPDGVIDERDVQELVNGVMGREFGDADLDGDVDINDFNELAARFDPLGQAEHHGWANGNFDGDDDIDIWDFNLLAINFAPLGNVMLGHSSSKAASNPLDESSAGTPPPNLTGALVEMDSTRHSLTVDAPSNTSVSHALAEAWGIRGQRHIASDPSKW